MEYSLIRINPQKFTIYTSAISTFLYPKAVFITLLSSPAPHQNTEPPLPLLLLVVTTTAEILKESRKQHTSRRFSFHHLNAMAVTTPFIEFNAINDQDLKTAIGGARPKQDREDDKAFWKRHKQHNDFCLAK